MKNNNYTKTQHSVYKLTYHLILVTKYRKQVITDDIADTIKITIERFNKNYNLEIIEYNYEKDHLHLLFSIQPDANMQKIVNAMKAATSRIVRKKYPEVKKILYNNAFWSRGYFIATIGDINTDVSTEIIKQYIKNQSK